jgi:tetrahydromethanopterin S-methyltransferase subunit B
MNLTAIIIVAIIVGGITSIISTLSNKKTTESKKFSKQERDDLQVQIHQMNERIETLERIVTDEKYSLNQQFADLK